MKVVLLLAALVALGVLFPIARAVFALLFVRAAVRKGLEDVGSQALAKTPERISLVHQNLHSWKADPAVARFSDPLFSKGFQEGGLYALREMPGVSVRFQIKPAECLVAGIFMHPKAGVWLDLVTYYQDGRTSTFSTNRDPGLDPRPGHPIVYAPGAAAPTLLAKAVGERPKGVFRSIMVEDLVTLFERSHAESVAWRKNKGISASEVVKVAQRKAS